MNWEKTILATKGKFGEHIIWFESLTIDGIDVRPMMLIAVEIDSLWRKEYQSQQLKIALNLWDDSYTFDE